MDGQVRSAGGLIEEISLAGKLYRARTITIKSVVSLKAKARLSVQSDCVALAARAAQGLPDAARKEILEMGFRKAAEARSASTDDMDAFLESEVGMAAVMFETIERADGTRLASEEDAFALLEIARDEGKLSELSLKLQLAFGVGELKNSSGQGTEMPIPPLADPSMTDGPPSIGPSQSSTVSPPTKLAD